MYFTYISVTTFDYISQPVSRHVSICNLGHLFKTLLVYAESIAYGEIFAWNSYRHSSFFCRQLLKHGQKTKLGNVVYFHVEKARKAQRLIQKAIINISVREIEATRQRA
jgi:hypothetical protein